MSGGTTLRDGEDEKADHTSHCRLQRHADRQTIVLMSVAEDFSQKRVSGGATARTRQLLN